MLCKITSESLLVGPRKPAATSSCKCLLQVLTERYKWEVSVCNQETQVETTTLSYNPSWISVKTKSFKIMEQFPKSAIKSAAYQLKRR